MVKGFNNLRKSDVICRRGSDPAKMLKYIQLNMHILKRRYKVIVLHIGTNYFGSRNEWGKYLQFVNDQCSFAEYTEYIDSINATPAKGSVYTFKNTIKLIIDLIKFHTNALIVISGIIPRPWDHERRANILRVYNDTLKGLQDRRVVFIDTPKLFFLDDELATRFFDWDGLHLNVEGHKLLQSFFGEKIWSLIEALNLFY